MFKASKFFSDIAESFSSPLWTAVMRDFRHGLEDARERSVVTSLETGIFSEACAKQPTNWKTQCEGPGTVAIQRSHDTSAEVEFDFDVLALTERQVGNETSDGALSVVSSSLSDNGSDQADNLSRLHEADKLSDLHEADNLSASDQADYLSASDQADYLSASDQADNLSDLHEADNLSSSDQADYPSASYQADSLSVSVISLVKVDIESAGERLGVYNNGVVSGRGQKHMTDRAEAIRRMLAGFSSHTEPWSSEAALPKGGKILKASESLDKWILQTEIGSVSDCNPLNNRRSKDGLQAGKLLPQRSKDGLQAGKPLPQSLQMCLRALFATLVQQLRCCGEKHFMRLKLTGFVDSIGDESRPSFDLYLSDGRDCARCYWVESKCTFVRELDHGEQNCCNFIEISVIEKRKLSVLLREIRTRDLGAQTDSGVRSARGMVRAMQLGALAKSNSSITPVVSLASLIEQDQPRHGACRILNAHDFTIQEKDTLCFNLALSLLHMASGDWGRVVWYPDNPDTELGIFFLWNPSTRKIVDITRPYMSLRLQKRSSIDDPAQRPNFDTQLLDFARLLIEIHGWKRLPNLPSRQLHEMQSEDSELAKDRLRRELLVYIKRNFRQHSEAGFIAVLEACLAVHERMAADAKEDPEKIQKYVFENIVNPLHRYFGSPELDILTLSTRISSDEVVSDSTYPPEDSVPIYDASFGSNEPEERCSNETQFWDNMAKFTEKCISSSQSYTLPSGVETEGRQKVRIAVIDSGVKQEDADIAAAQANSQLQGYRNFTSSDLSDCEDHLGHGTMVARLLLTVAPEAELYIAKVSDQSNMPKNQLHRIASAIKWALEHWRVNIISISLALDEEHHDINEELDHALFPITQGATGKLVFAAAGNSAVYKPQAWPARKTGVIAVHATDWSGQGTKINPNPVDRVNFATLGQDIKMRWPDGTGELSNTYISGSSFATPIAAGIAANVLEFARHRLKINDYTRSILYSHHGMYKVLEAMSRSRGGYEFLHPFALWEKAFRGGDIEIRGKKLYLPREDDENICKVLTHILT